MSSAVMFIRCFGLICNYAPHMGWTLQSQLNTLTASVTTSENKPFFTWYIKMWRFSDHLTCSEPLNIILHFQAFRWEFGLELLWTYFWNIVSSVLAEMQCQYRTVLQLLLLNCRVPVQILLLDIFQYQSEGLGHYWHVN